MKRLLTVLVFSGVLFGAQMGSAQSEEFKHEQLSAKGRVAYNKLVTACIFRVGGVGYSGETSKEEMALYDLLEEAHALAALRSLVKTGSYEGGLYGLLGLSIRDHGEFNRAVEIYKVRKDSAECKETGLSQYLVTNRETVVTQSGCIIDVEPREKVVSEIQSGRYDRMLNAKYRPLSPHRIP